MRTTLVSMSTSSSRAWQIPVPNDLVVLADHDANHPGPSTDGGGAGEGLSVGAVPRLVVPMPGEETNSSSPP